MQIPGAVPVQRVPVQIAGEVPEGSVQFRRVPVQRVPGRYLVRFQKVLVQRPCKVREGFWRRYLVRFRKFPEKMLGEVPEGCGADTSGACLKCTCLKCYLSFKQCRTCCKGLLHTLRNGVLYAKSFYKCCLQNLFPTNFIQNIWHESVPV